MKTARIKLRVLDKKGQIESEVQFFRAYTLPLPCWARMEELAKSQGERVELVAYIEDGREFVYNRGWWLSFQDWWFDAYQ